MQTLNIVAKELFNKIRGRFPSVTIGDGEGNVTTTPEQARFYDFDFIDTKRDIETYCSQELYQKCKILYSDLNKIAI